VVSPRATHSARPTASRCKYSLDFMARPGRSGATVSPLRMRASRGRSMSLSASHDLGQIPSIAGAQPIPRTQKENTRGRVFAVTAQSGSGDKNGLGRQNVGAMISGSVCASSVPVEHISIAAVRKRSRGFWCDCPSVLQSGARLLVGSLVLSCLTAGLSQAAETVASGPQPPGRGPLE
jgi:hypothetical protein